MYTYTKQYKSSIKEPSLMIDCIRSIEELQRQDIEYARETFGPAHSSYSFTYGDNNSVIWYFKRREDLVQFKLARG